MPERDYRKEWTDQVQKALVGRKITSVRYMNQTEMDACGWYSAAIILELDDGNSIWPSQDDEGNNAGAIFTTFDKLPTIPVI